MNSNQKAALFEKVIQYGVDEVTRQLLTMKGSDEALALIPAMGLTILMVSKTPYMQLSDGRIFRNEEIMAGPTGEPVVRGEFESMLRKVEREMQRRVQEIPNQSVLKRR